MRIGATWPFGRKAAETRTFIEAATREHGTSARTFKSALLWAVPENPDALREEGRKALAWEDIQDEEDDLKLDDTQRRHLGESVKKAERDLKEAVWRAYKNVMLLGKDGNWKSVDLGLVHSSAAETLSGLIVARLKEQGDIEDGLSPNFLVRNWSPAFVEWSTRAVRDACFASPQFPRLLNPDAIKLTISKGVEIGAMPMWGRGRTEATSPSCGGRPAARSKPPTSRSRTTFSSSRGK